MTEHTKEAPAAARLNGLVKTFSGFQLGPLDLTLAPGTVLALVGPNGAGKTTTLNCMAGLIVPDEGGTEVYGTPVHPTRTEYRLRRRLCRRGKRIFSALDRPQESGLSGAADSRLVKGPRHETCRSDCAAIRTPVNKLSRGNKTKLAIVAALAHGPRLLLLDEPTAGLDPVVRAEVLDVLWEITEDGEHAVLYSTHVLSDINRLADELVFLRDGQIVLRTGRDELSERWRRVSFRLQDDDVELPDVVEHRRVRTEHQVITRDAEATIQRLTDLGAEAVEVSRMSVDEIAVQILKEGHHVERTEN